MKRLFIIPMIVGLFWTLLLLALFLWNFAGENRHVKELAEYQARSFFLQIVAARAWNSAHGGVFVPVGPNAEPNPHLPSGERILKTETGETLVRINPAYMTRQIAEIAKVIAQDVGIRFHITSLMPIRPENAPDKWESEALSVLQADGDYFEAVPGAPGQDQFRYMAPLITEASCRRCHPKDAVGSIRGGISVSAPAGPLILPRVYNQRQQAVAYGIIWFVGLVGIVGSTFEINRRREKAVALSQMRSRFLANMSHDMRTPLTGIIGLSDRLVREDLSPKAAGYARLITHSAGALLEVVGDILDYARLESSRLELKNQPFDVRKAVEQTGLIFAFAAEEKGLAFSHEVMDSVPARLLGDAFRFRQVLANLLGNAVKFTDHGSVRVTVDAMPGPQGRLVLRTAVIDTGVGIAAEEQSRIFECFCQVDDSLARRHAGSGLGLSIARQLAVMMGGGIRVDSAPGQGSTFTALLAEAPPVREEAPPAGEATAPAQESLAGLRLLVVDDQRANLILLDDILREDGAEVRLATSSREALEIFPQSPLDLLLLDLQMPEMDGLELARRIRTLETDLGRRRTPILILTAFATPEDAEAMPLDDISGVVTKPIDLAALRRAIRETLAMEQEAPGANAPGAEALIETGESLKRLGGRQDLYRMLAMEFLSSAPGLAERFDAAARDADFSETTRIAHTLKSGAAALGALPLRDTAARLEQLSKERKLPSERRRAALHKTLELTCQALRGLIKAV
ncbi:MAG: DUF3365 domain-containing protein [Desulfovibrio sp.]|nr:DUF3365 domain-containing protein [Desulfovibrio sp.]